MRLAAFCLVSRFVFVTGCVATKTESIEGRAITADYEIDGVKWQNGGVLAVLYKVYEENDFVALCGAHTSDTRKGVGGTTFNELALQSMSISIDEKVIMRDLTAFQKIPFQADDNLANGQATCYLTDIPWQAKYGIPWTCHGLVPLRVLSYAA